MANSIKVSNTGIASDSPIAVYAGTKEDADLLPSQKKVFPSNVVGATYMASTELSTDELDFEVDLVVDDETSTETEATKVVNDFEVTMVPQLSDISILSNQVVYDAAGNPTSTVVFKVKNSSGLSLKGMNARIQAI